MTRGVRKQQQIAADLAMRPKALLESVAMASTA